jgi:hypothetical protein
MVRCSAPYDIAGISGAMRSAESKKMPSLPQLSKVRMKGGCVAAWLLVVA